MSFESTTSRNGPTTGDGATSNYAYSFRIDDEDDLLVTVALIASPYTLTTLTKTTDYTVNSVGSSTGTIDLVNNSQAWLTAGKLSTTYTISLRRKVPLTQPEVLRDNSSSVRETIEDSLDRVVQQNQTQQDQLDRSIRLPESENPSSYTLTVPVAASRASKYLSFDASGNVTATSAVVAGAVTISSFAETYLDDSTAVATRQTLLLDKAGADIASAATVNLDSSTGDLVNITGTTTITAITLAEGVEKTVRFSGALTLTYNASTLILPTSASITTAAGDYAVFRGYASSVVRCVSYHRLHGGPVCSFAQDFQARLTLASATPVTASDQSAKTTIYLTPYLGNRLALYDGADWVLHKLTEISIAVPATTSQMYDLFVYNNSGTLTLEAVAWTNDTTRATALTRQDGVYVKTGTLTKRYCGSFRTTTASGETEDSFAKRYLWNYHNRVPRPMRVIEATNTWTYTTATIRQANGAATNQLDFISGVDEVPVSAKVVHHFSNDNAGVVVSAGIALDSTTAFTASSGYVSGTSPVANHINALHAHYQGFPGVGRHVLVWLERSVATGTSTMYGDNGALLLQSGIWGELMG